MKKMNRIEDFLKPTQEQLFKIIARMYAGKTIAAPGKWILVKGEAPVMLVAHMDTVHKEPVRDICKTDDGNILMSPQGIGGDDRCGVYALTTIYKKAPVKPWLLFTCDEEVGGIGAKDFCVNHADGRLPKGINELKALIEIDRKGENDAVYYDCDNLEFEDYITSMGFVTNYGSFSDISLIAPELGIAAVNLSSGYYNAHTQYEYIDIRHLNRTIERVLAIVTDAANPKFPVYEYVDRAFVYDEPGYYGYCNWEDFTDIPESIRREYDLLLDYYSEDELEQIRQEYGDGAIKELFYSEFGRSYKDLFGREEEE